MLRPQLLLLGLSVLLAAQASERSHGSYVPPPDFATLENEELDYEKTSEMRSKRGAPDFSRLKWNKAAPIPYTLDSAFNEEAKTAIRSGLQSISANTCLDFKEDYGPGAKLQYVLLSQNYACNSQVGHFGENYSTNISLHDGCFHEEGVHHETMHALGLRHTQVRHDRDKYIRMDGSLNTKPNGNVDTNYLKLEIQDDTTDYGIPYEFNSLLHYTANAKFEARDPDYNMSLGGSFMTFLDWKLINAHYKCNEKCDSQITCQNGGYQNPRKCKECVCPLFYKGTYCSEEKGAVVLKMGETTSRFDAYPENKTVFDQPIRFLDFNTFDRSPVLLFKAPEGTRIRVTIVNITDPHTRYDIPRRNCNDQAVEIVDGDLTRVGKRFCMVRHIGRSFLSETNIVGYRAFTRPGSTFKTNVTFTVEGTPVSPPTEQPPTSTTTTVVPMTTTTTETPTTTTQVPTTTTTEVPTTVTTTTQEPPTTTTAPVTEQPPTTTTVGPTDDVCEY